MRAFISFANRRQTTVWIAQWMPWLMLAVAMAAMSVLLAGGGVAEGQDLPPTCTGLDVAQDETTPGARVDLTFKFTPENCSPGELGEEFTITLDKDLKLPAQFDEDNVTIRARQRFKPDWADVGQDDDGNHEIELPGCQSWGPSVREEVGVCERARFPVSIELEDVQLPDQPARYKVSITWPSGSSNALDDTIGVDATLKIDGVDEVGYGKTIEFKGSGFSEGVSVNLYARPGASSTNCKGAEVSSWTNIGSSSVGSNYRFVTEVEISTNVFRSAGKYQICALDGAGVSSGTSLAITVEAGIKVVGGGSNRNFRPGDQITVTIEGGGSNVGISQVLIGGRPANWNRGGGNNLFVTIPSSASGTITVAVIFTEGPTASANIIIGAIDLSVQGIGAAGIGLGQTVIVSASNLPGDQVCSVALGGVRLAFLDGDRIDSDGCVSLVRGGRLVGTVVVADKRGEISGDLIRKLLDSDGDETLEITTSTGAKAGADVKVAPPGITFDPPDGEVSLRDTVIITGVNFPRESSYYRIPNITVTIDGRSRPVYTTGSTWRETFEVTSGAVSGSNLRVDVKINNYPLSELTATYRIKIAPGELTVTPAELKIGAPVNVAVSGLNAFTAGYSIRIANGPPLRFGSETRFQTNREGEFTGRSIIPVEYHEDVATASGKSATLYVYRSGERIPGVFATVTLRQERYVAPTPTPTITPTPTNTPIPTNTPLPTDTPIPPPTDTPVPPTSTPLPPTHTPVPPPTDTPVPPPTINRTAIVQTVTAAVIPSDDDRTVVDRPASAPESPDGGLSTLSIVLLAVVGFIVLAMITGIVALVALRSRRVGPEQPPFDDLPSI